MGKKDRIGAEMDALEEIIRWMLNGSSKDTLDAIFDLDDEIVPRLHEEFPYMSRAMLADIWHAGMKILADVVSEEADYG